MTSDSLVLEAKGKKKNQILYHQLTFNPKIYCLAVKLVLIFKQNYIIIATSTYSYIGLYNSFQQTLECFPLQLHTQKSQYERGRAVADLHRD